MLYPKKHPTPNEADRVAFHEVGHVLDPMDQQFLSSQAMRETASRTKNVQGKRLDVSYDENIPDAFADGFAGNALMQYRQQQYLRQHGKPMPKEQQESLAKELADAYSAYGGEATGTKIPEGTQWNATGDAVKDTRTILDRLGIDVPPFLRSR